MSKNVLYFSAPWCQPCKVFGPQFDAVLSESEIKHKKINIDEEPELVSSFGVRGVPTVIVFDGEKETGRASGPALNRTKLTQLLG